MAMSGKDLVYDIKINWDDYGIKAGVKEVENDFKRLNPVLDRANNMMSSFTETVNKMGSAEGPDKLTVRLYKVQKIAVGYAKEIQNAYAQIEQVMSAREQAKALIPEGSSIEQLKAMKAELIESLTALYQQEKYFERELPSAIEKTYAEIVKTTTEMSALGRERKSNATSPERLEAISNRSSELQTKLEGLRTKFANLTAEQEKSSASLIECKKNIEELETKLTDVKSILSANKPMSAVEMETISSNLRAMARAFAGLQESEMQVRAIENSYKDANKASNKFNNDSYRYAKRHSSALKTLSNIVKKLSHGFKELLKHTRKSFDSSQNGMKQALRSVMRYGLGVRSLYFLFRRLRSAAKDAFGVMAQQWEPVNKQISSMIQSLNGVKGSIATMLQPLLEGFANFFNQFMGILQKVMETIGAFFAFLTGQNYILRAKAGGVDWADHLADKLGQAKDEAEELNKQLAGFDKINNLTTKDNKDKDNDKSSIGLDTVTFEKVPIEQLDIFNWLKDMWLKSDFGDLGRFLNEKLLGILQKIDWDEIERLGRKIGTCIATAVNGFFENDALAYEIGEAIAGWLNTKFATIYEFANRVEWDEIGLFIVTGIKSFFDTAKFDEWGAAAESLLGGLIEALYVVATDKEMWQKAGDNIINGINAFLTEGLKKKKVHVGFGMNHIPIYEELNDFEMAGGALSGFITNFIDTITSILGNKELQVKVGQALGNFLSGIDWNGIYISLKNFASALLGAMKTAITEAYKTDPDFFKLAVKVTLIITLARFLLSFISGFMSGLIGTLKDSLPQILEQAFKALKGFKWAELGEAGFAITTIATFAVLLNKFQMKVDDAFRKKASKGVQDALDKADAFINGVINDKFKSKSPVTPGGAGGASLIMGFKIGELLDVIPKTIDVLTKFINMFHKVDSKVKEITSTIQETWSKFWTNLFDNWSESIQKREGHLTKFEEFLKTLSLAALGWGIEWSEFWEKVGEKIDEFKTNAVEKFIEIKTAISDKVHEIATSLSEKWTEVTDAWSSLWTNMAEIIKTPINNIIDLINNGLIASIEGMMNGLGGGISEFANSGTGKFLGFDKIPVFTIEIPRIPHLAKGAVIPPNNQFLAMLGDQKSGTNIEAPISTIEDAVRNVLNTIELNVTFDVQGDPEHIFNIVKRQSNQFVKRTGLNWT